jgi:hypothetical protein
MKIPFLALLALTAAAAIQAQAGDGPPDKRKTQMSESEPVRVEAAAPGQWRISVERKLDEASATGQVVVRSGAAPDPAHAPHVRLAGVRAWLSLAQGRIAARQFEKAIACAGKAVEELGRDYARPEVDDSTQQKLLAAQEQAAEGQLENAANNMVRILQNRVALYLDRHRDAIVE